jgi:hypothetical protein
MRTSWAVILRVRAKCCSGVLQRWHGTANDLLCCHFETNAPLSALATVAAALSRPAEMFVRAIALPIILSSQGPADIVHTIGQEYSRSSD